MRFDDLKIGGNKWNPFGKMSTQPLPRYRSWGDITGREGEYSPFDVVQDIIDEFNAMPVTYQKDPTTGNVIATKTMQTPEIPKEMAGSFVSPELRRIFGRDNLSMKWILPAGAMDESIPRYTQRQAPLSEDQREMISPYMSSEARSEALHRQGIKGNVAGVNAGRYWPSSTFKVPLQKGSYGMSIPRFGGTFDYTSGRYRFPSYSAGGLPGIHLRWPGLWGKMKDFAQDPRFRGGIPGYGKTPALSPNNSYTYY